MKSPQDSTYQSWHISQFELEVAGLETALYGPEQADPAKQTVLLVHGMGGDRHGMIPLGYELKDHYNVYFVELPGHGRTKIPSDRRHDFWWRWAEDLTVVLERKSIRLDLVVGHSSGCAVVAAMRLPSPARYVMLMPVPIPTKTHQTYIKVLSVFRRSIAPWYGWYRVALWRGVLLLRRHTREALDAVRWVSKKTAYSRWRFYYQLELALHWPTSAFYHHVEKGVASRLTIIMGAEDSIPAESYFELRKRLPEADVRLLPGGHLLPIESPSEVAEEIRLSQTTLS